MGFFDGFDMRHVAFGAVCAVSGARKVVEGMAAICHLGFVIRVEKKISHRFKVQFGRILDNLFFSVPRSHVQNG